MNNSRQPKPELVEKFEDPISDYEFGVKSLTQSKEACAKIALAHSDERIEHIINYFEGVYHETDFGKGKDVAKIIRSLAVQQ